MPQPKRTKGSKARAEIFVLCDFARFENGKLDILGAGWDTIHPPALPFPYQFFVAARVMVPAVLATKPVPLKVEIADESGRIVEPGEADLRVIIEPLVDTPTHVDGEIPLMLPLRIDLTLVLAGAYTIKLVVAGAVISHTSFRVAEPAALPVTIDVGPEEVLDPPARNPQDLLAR